MCSTEIKWERSSNGDDVGKLATCGVWMADLARNAIYSPGLAFIQPPQGNSSNWPKQLGDELPDEGIPNPAELCCLTHELSLRMRKNLRCILHDKCKCTNVYLVSLNENERKEPLHFRLWPRYEHDQHVMDILDETGNTADGFALMAFWRKQYLRRRAQANDWGLWPPDRDMNFDGWRQYARRIKGMLVPDVAR